MARNDSPRVAVLGAGPVGLEAALYAATLKLPVIVYERDAVGAHPRRWGHVRLFSPSGMNRTSLGIATLKAHEPGHKLPAADECVTGVQLLKEQLAAVGVQGLVQHVRHRLAGLRSQILQDLV